MKLWKQFALYGALSALAGAALLIWVGNDEETEHVAASGIGGILIGCALILTYHAVLARKGTL